MEQVLGESLSLRRFLMLLIGIFAGIAVLLGLVGVYGVLAYLVGQRRQEIAIRVALGATTIGDRLARRQARVGPGIWRCHARPGRIVALSRVLEGTLFGVSALDPLTYVLASVAAPRGRGRRVVAAGMAGDARSSDHGTEE